MRAPVLLAAIIAGSITVACGDEPLAPPSPRTTQTTETALYSQGVIKTPISGAFQPPHDGTPLEETVITPSGHCQGRGASNIFDVTGDLEGTLEAHYDPQVSPCDLVEPEPGTRLTSMGLMEGTVTYDGKTGSVAGHWNTECRPGNTIVGLTCDGIVNLRGHGDLEGTQFHLDWGPGWWPFPYTGAAFSR